MFDHDSIIEIVKRSVNNGSNYCRSVSFCRKSIPTYYRMVATKYSYYLFRLVLF